METLIATASFIHNGEQLRPGDEIKSVTDDDRADLIAIGMAEVRLRGMADALVKAAASMRPPPKRMGYTRRDSPKVSEDEKV